MNQIWQSLLFTLGIPAALVTTLKIVDDVFGSGSIGKKLATSFSDTKFYKKPQQWCINAFLAVNEIFGDRLISWRSFIISSIITIIWSVIQIVVSYFFYKNGAIKNIIFDNDIILIKFLLLLLSCILIDYVSVCVTRFVFKKMVKEHALLSVILDFIISVLLFYFSYKLSKFFIAIRGYQDFLTYFQESDFFITILNWFSSPFEIHSELYLLNDVLVSKNASGQVGISSFKANILYAFPEGMLFISSLFTSIWIWSFSISLWLFSLLKKINNAKDFLVKESSINNKPYLSIGTIITILFFIPVFILHLMLSYILGLY